MARGDGGAMDVGGCGAPPISTLAEQVRAAVAGFDPALESARGCLGLVETFRDIEHSASAGLALAARRVAQTDLWSKNGDRSAAHWLARTTGMAISDAVRMLQTAEVAEQAPATMDALRNGDVSIREGNATGKAEAADPKAGAELVARTIENSGLSVREIEQDSARIVNAASGDTEAQRAAKVRERRALRIGSRGDGSSWLHLEGPTVDLARLEASLQPIIKGIFDDARRQGRHEPLEAYAYDALMQMSRRSGDDSGGGGHERDKVIIRADLTALDRGHVEPGEICEIAGHGPIPVADAWRSIDGGAFIAAVIKDGDDVMAAQHLGRRPTALQRTVLELETAGTCVVEGCTNKVRIEIDHTDDWAHTHLTQIRDLAAPCRHCHAKKTYQGYRLGPRLTNGKRTLLPPSTAGTGPPTGGTPEAPAPHQTTPDQPGLFDTS
jgi:hypothetical protein